MSPAAKGMRRDWGTKTLDATSSLPPQHDYHGG